MKPGIGNADYGSGHSSSNKNDRSYISSYVFLKNGMSISRKPFDKVWNNRRLSEEIDTVKDQRYCMKTIKELKTGG